MKYDFGFFLKTLKEFEDRQVAKDVLEIILKNKMFFPAKFDNRSPLKRKYQGDIEVLVDEWMFPDFNGGSSMFLKNNKNGFLGLLGWEKKEWAKANHINLNLNKEPEEIEEIYREAMETFFELVQYLKPYMAQVGIEYYTNGAFDSDNQYPQLQWMNLFGKEYVEFIGRERLLATPGCYKIFEPAEDTVVLQLEESPLTITPKNRKKRIMEYLGTELFISKKRGVEYNIPFIDLSAFRC